MSISGTGLATTGLPFIKAPMVPLKAAAAAIALEEKITNAVADSQASFMRLEAAELKKRISFYERFDGKIGNNAMDDIASQTANIIARMSLMGRTL